MSARVLAYRIALFALLREIRYTLSQMAIQPLAAVWVPMFKGLRDEWTNVLLAEVVVIEGLVDAQAAVDKADEGLDDFAGRVARAIEDFAGGSIKKQLTTNLFKGIPLSRFRKPVLNGQLLMMAS